MISICVDFLLNHPRRTHLLAVQYHGIKPCVVVTLPYALCIDPCPLALFVVYKQHLLSQSITPKSFRVLDGKLSYDVRDKWCRGLSGNWQASCI